MDDCVRLTPEEKALEILAALAESFKRGHGCALSFIECLHASRKRIPVSREELLQGIEFAVRQGWVQILEDVLLYRLTQAGFLRLSQHGGGRHSLLSQFVL